jgi:NitT/TauT family transport system substrate-binding protein
MRIPFTRLGYGLFSLTSRRCVGLWFAVAIGMCLAWPSQAQDKIVVAALRSTGAMPLFVAQDLGILAAERLTAQFKFFDTATPVPLAIVSGDADFGVNAFSAAFYNLAGKGALRIIGGTARAEPGYRQIGFVVSPRAYEANFRSLKDLPGKTIGLTTVGSTFYYGVWLQAKRHGFDYAEIKFVPLQTFSNSIAALKGGQVEAILLPSSLAIPVHERGDGRIIGWDDGTPWQISGLFTSTRNVSERRPMVEAFVRAYVRASRLIFDAVLRLDAAGNRTKGPGHDQVLDIIAKYLGQKPEQVSAGIGYIDPEGRLKVNDIYDQVAFWQSQGLVDKGVNPKDFIDLSFIPGHLDLPR